MITLYGFGSPNVLKILIALKELDLPFRHEPIDVFRGEQFEGGFGALTPNRKVPVIVDEEGPDGGPLTLWESGAILIHLAEKTGRLLPAKAGDRLIALQWLMWQMAGVGPMFGQLSHFRVFSPEAEHGYARARYATEVKRLYDVAEARLAQAPYLGGADYSIADIAAWPWLHRAAMRGVDLASLPSVSRWVEEVARRPAVVKAKAFFDGLGTADVPKLMREEGDAVDRYLQRGRYSRPEL